MRHRLDTWIDIETCRLLFRGHMRDVYEHPEFENVLIKVIRPDRVDAEGQFISWRRKKISLNRTFGLYVSFQREIREMLRAAKTMHGRKFRVPFAEVHGLVLTSQGLGLLVEKITAADGAPAPTLGRLIKEGRFAPEHRELLDRFFEACAEHHIVLGDIHASNLVLEQTTGGEARFVCIDGVGEKALLPVHEWSDFINRMKLKRSQRRMQKEIERAMIRAQAATLPGAV